MRRFSRGSRALFKIVDCQGRIAQTGSIYGWLEKQKGFNTWSRRFIVSIKGTVYIFKHEKSSKHSSHFSLQEYTSVETLEKLEGQDQLWILKIVHSQGTNTKQFLAASHLDLLKWAKHFDEEIQKLKIMDSIPRTPSKYHGRYSDQTLPEYVYDQVVNNPDRGVQQSEDRERRRSIILAEGRQPLPLPYIPPEQSEISPTLPPRSNTEYMRVIDCSSDEERVHKRNVQGKTKRSTLETSQEKGTTSQSDIAIAVRPHSSRYSNYLSFDKGAKINVVAKVLDHLLIGEIDDRRGAFPSDYTKPFVIDGYSFVTRRRSPPTGNNILSTEELTDRHQEGYIYAINVQSRQSSLNWPHGTTSEPDIYDESRRLQDEETSEPRPILHPRQWKENSTQNDYSETSSDDEDDYKYVDYYDDSSEGYCFYENKDDVQYCTESGETSDIYDDFSVGCSSDEEPVHTRNVQRKIKRRTLDNETVTHDLTYNVIALESYNAQSYDEISFHKEDKFRVVGQDSERWLVGEVNGNKGLFPAEYVKKCRMFYQNHYPRPKDGRPRAVNT